MASTSNSSGTRYRGKRNLSTRQAVCGHCGRQATLSSYDATEFFAFIFPRRRFHILDECSFCGQRRAIDKKEWDELNSRAVKEAVQRFRARPVPETIQPLLATLHDYGMRDHYLALADELERRVFDCNDAATSIRLGETALRFQDSARAERAFGRSLQLAESPEARAGLARALQQRRPDQPWPAQPAPAPTAGNRHWPILLVGLFAVVALMVAAAAVLFLGSLSTSVYLVNGLSKPYTIEIDGQRHQLKPGMNPAIDLPPRKPLKLVATFGEKSEEQEFTIPSEWYNVLDSRVFVLNPDRAALFMIESATYFVGGAPEGHEEGKSRYYGGEALHTFMAIDYPFQPFPEEIQMKTTDLRKVKLAVQLVEIPSHMRPQTMAESDPKKGAVLAERLLRLEEGLEEDYREFIAYYLDFERYRELAAAELAASPVKIGWHQRYQDLGMDEGQAPQLVAEYRERLQRAPVAANHHLLARVLEAPEALPVLLRGLAAAEPSAWVYQSLAFEALANARFAEALEYVAARKRFPEQDEQFARTEAMTLVANGRHAEALALYEELGEWPQVPLAAILGQPERIEPLVESTLEGIDATVAAGWRPYYEVDLCYPEGLSCYERKLSLTTAMYGKFDLGLVEKDIANIPPVLRESPRDVYSRLIVAVVFGEKGSGARQEAVKLLKANGNSESQLLAAALAGEKVDRERLLKVVADVDVKRLALAAIALRDRDPAMAAMAQRLNFQPGLIQLLIRRAFDEAPASPPS